jgi:hypothetical protein
VVNTKWRQDFIAWVNDDRSLGIKSLSWILINDRSIILTKHWSQTNTGCMQFNLKVYWWDTALLLGWAPTLHMTAMVVICESPHGGLIQRDILLCSSVVGYFGRAWLQSLMHISKLEMKHSDISLREAFMLENVNKETSGVQSRGVGTTWMEINEQVGSGNNSCH